MSKWVVDIHGDIEGDYEIIKKYEETCEDCISRQAVLNLFNKSDDYRWETNWIRRKIEKLPSVTPKAERSEEE